MRSQTTVEAVLSSHGNERVEAVRLADGETIETETVIDAAGLW